MKQALPDSEKLFEQVLEHLGPKRAPLLIAIDGADGVGKSSLASWLAWQIGAPAIHLDLYLINDGDALFWRIRDLQRIMKTRLDDHGRPLIVEGIMVLEALAEIGREADFLVYVDGEGGGGLAEYIGGYRRQFQSERHADFRMQGYVE